MEPDPEEVLARLWASLNGLPCSKREFVGEELYQEVQMVLYGYCEDEDDEEETDEVEDDS